MASETNLRDDSHKAGQLRTDLDGVPPDSCHAPPARPTPFREVLNGRTLKPELCGKQIPESRLAGASFRDRNRCSRCASTSGVCLSGLGMGARGAPVRSTDELEPHDPPERLRFRSASASPAPTAGSRSAQPATTPGGRKCVERTASPWSRR